MTQDKGLSAYSIIKAERLQFPLSENDIISREGNIISRFHRIYYPTLGRAKLCLADKEIYLDCGRVYFIPAYLMAQCRIEGKTEIYYLEFFSEHPLLEMYRYLSDSYSVKANEHTPYLLENIVEGNGGATYSAKMRVFGAMNLLMADFLRDLPLERGGVSKFVPVLKYINEHYRENISLSALAEIMNISTMYFSGFFKRTFNISPKQYILNKRIAESQILLLETDMTVKEIAYLVGFEGENYFSEYFSFRTGISALRFRAKHSVKKA